jgi:hypothetical protein
MDFSRLWYRSDFSWIPNGDGPGTLAEGELEGERRVELLPEAVSFILLP